jgi:peptide deformylase
LQHEIDHLYGILYYDRINKEDKNFIGEDWISV